MMAMTDYPSGVVMMRYWPLFVGAVFLVGALFVGQRNILVNAGEITTNATAIRDTELDLGSLENRVNVESAATALALQRLRLKQEAAISAQASTAKRQDDKLDNILRALTRP